MFHALHFAKYPELARTVLRNKNQTLTVWCRLHWHWFTKGPPPSSVLSCHLHVVLSVRFQSSHCVLLNHSREGDAVWRRAAITLTILQDAGSDGTAGSLHWRVIPIELDINLCFRLMPDNVETGGCHCSEGNIYFAWGTGGIWEGETAELDTNGHTASHTLYYADVHYQ